MLVAFGENGIKNVEDLAGCATDDLVGWTERKDGENVREPGILDGFDLSPRSTATTSESPIRCRKPLSTMDFFAPIQVHRC
jgi:hypothetical protein